MKSVRIFNTERGIRRVSHLKRVGDLKIDRGGLNKRAMAIDLDMYSGPNFVAYSFGICTASARYGLPYSSMFIWSKSIVGLSQFISVIRLYYSCSKFWRVILYFVVVIMTTVTKLALWRSQFGSLNSAQTFARRVIQDSD
jgi:hypothetical protein